MKGAMRGADSLFLTIDFAEDYDKSYYETLLTIAKTVKIKFVILLCYFTNYQNSEVSNRFKALEKVIQSKKINYCFIHTGYSLQNILRTNSSVHSTKTIKFITDGDTTLNFMDERDLIEFIVQVLQQPENHEGQGKQNILFYLYHSIIIKNARKSKDDIIILSFIFT